MMFLIGCNSQSVANSRETGAVQSETQQVDTKIEQLQTQSDELETEIVNIRASLNKKIEYETFDNGMISMKIPKGWKVQIPENVYYPCYTFMVTSPENENYRIFVNLKFEGYVKSQAARDFFIRYYGSDHIFAKTPILEELSTEYYFRNAFTETAELNSSSAFSMPRMDNFTVIENFGATIYGGDLLRGNYIDRNGDTVEGLFTASPKDIGSNYINEDIVSLSGEMIDIYYRNVYDTMFITTPEGDFVNWEEALTACLNSIEFSDAFLREFNSAQEEVMQTIQANSKVYSQISDMVMSSWESRNYSYDIMSQKQSDVTLGYERVYDTETGEIYKAYNGFMDDYKGDRYQPAIDDMYAKSIDGYIEK